MRMATRPRALRRAFSGRPAPRPKARAPTGPRSRRQTTFRAFSPAPHYEWANSTVVYGTTVYSHIDDSLSAVATHIRENGPYDGLLGFSQGAMLAALVAARCSLGESSVNLRFAIICGAAMPQPHEAVRLLTCGRSRVLCRSEGTPALVLAPHPRVAGMRPAMADLCSAARRATGVVAAILALPLGRR